MTAPALLHLDASPIADAAGAGAAGAGAAGERATTDATIEACVRNLLPRRPYTGLRPFQKDEWPIFCGRDRMVQEVIDILGRSHLAFVVGASGSGKSSLVRAGVLATVEGRHGMVGVRWRTAAMRPGGEPFLALAEAVIDAEASPRGGQATAAMPGEVVGPSAVALSIRLENAERGLAAIADHLQLRDNENLLLLVDQFEEIFRYQAGTGASERQRFIEQLVRVADERPPGLYVAVTMRAEFLGECERYPGLADVVNRTLYLVPPLGRDDLREAITRPARLLDGDVEAALADRLLADVAGRDHLPILQHSLALMWAEGEGHASIDGKASGEGADGQAPVLTLARYQELKGDAQSLMARHCARIYAGLGPELGKVAQVMFRRMVEVEERRSGLRRPTRCGTVAELAGVGLHEVAQVAGAFAAEGASFLQIGRPPVTKETSLDITHESLIRQWPRLEGWLRDERRSCEALYAVARAARRHSDGEGALWSGRDLSIGLAWRDREGPTALWARRYEFDFGTAMRFLLESEEAERRKQEAREWAEEIEARKAAEKARREQEWLVEQERQRARQARTERDLEAERARVAAEREIAAAEREMAAVRMRQATRGWLRVAICLGTVCAGFAVAAVMLMLSAEEATSDAERATTSAVAAKQEAQNARSIAGRVLTLTGRAQRANDGASGSVLISLAFLKLNLDVPEVEGLAYAGLQRLRERRAMTSEGTQVVSVWFSNDRTVSAATADGRVETWGGEGFIRQPEYRVTVPPSMLRAKASISGERVLIGSPRDGGAVLRRVDGRLQQEWPEAPGEMDPRLGPGVLSGDGRLAVIGGLFGSPPALWDLDKRQQLWPQRGSDGPGPSSTAAAISKDGSRFAVAFRDRIQVRSTSYPYQELASLPMAGACGGTPRLFSLAFSPTDLDTMLATGIRGCVAVWRHGKASPVTLPGHEALVFEGVFSPDGALIATAGEDRSVRLWRMEDVRSDGSKAESVVVKGHTSSVFSVAFSPDGKSFASGSSDRTVRIWNVDPVWPERSERAPQPASNEASVKVQEAPKRGDNVTLQVRTADGYEQEIEVPYDFGEPALAAVSRDRGYILVAPSDGRPLLYRAKSPQAPIAELSEQRRKWDKVFFDAGEGTKPTAVSGSVTYVWNMFDAKNDLIAAAESYLPLRDGERVELSNDRQCLLSLIRGDECKNLPPDNSN